MMHPGIWVDTVHSVRDYGRCYASRAVSAPPKRVLKKTIPYRDGAIDFTKLNGAVYYDERTITYEFDVIGSTPFEVTKQVDDFTQWLTEITDADIHDDELPAWHWHGGCDEVAVNYEDGSGLKATITATFTVYPFRIADEYSSADIVVGTNEVYNEGRRARIWVIPDGTVTIKIGPVRQTFMGETYADIYLPHGYSDVEVTGGSAQIRWHEEAI